jgi:hypothetical protein
MVGFSTAFSAVGEAGSAEVAWEEVSSDVAACACVASPVTAPRMREVVCVAIVALWGLATTVCCRTPAFDVWAPMM